MGNRKAALSCRRDTALVQRQADDGGTVLFAERQNLFQRLLLTVDRVDDGLTVVDAQRTGQGLWIRGVELQRQVGDGLQILDKLLQRGGLVDAGQARVDVEHLRTGLGLGHSLSAGVGAVAVPQGLLQPFFAGGIDALPHHSDAVDLHKADRRAQTAAADGDLVSRGQRAEGLMQPGDKRGRRAAAAADHRNADGGVLLHLSGKFIRVEIVAAVGVRQTGVRLDKDRNTCGHAAAEALREGQNLLGAERAVDAHGVRAETRCRDGVAFDGAACEGAPAALKAH